MNRRELPLRGVRVVELATYMFVPVAGAVLAEWGAEVIKVEDTGSGDPYRGLSITGREAEHHGVDPFFHIANRNKRSIGVDLKSPDGRQLLGRLVKGCDVFSTNLLPDSRRRLRVDVEDIRADNPSVVYVRGSGLGPKGDEAGNGSFDMAAYWARSGMQYLSTPPGADWPARSLPAFGDIVSGLGLAGAVCAALYRRGASGDPSVVDVSLLAAGMWQLSADIVSARLLDDEPPHPGASHFVSRSPFAQNYRTRDRRFITLAMLAGDRYWEELCEVVGRPELASDLRFATPEARAENATECIESFQETFASRDYDDWIRTLANFRGEWAATKKPSEVHADPQVAANDYLAEVDVGGGVSLAMVTSPAQFDGRPNRPGRGPDHGEHTDQVLGELGLTDHEIAALRRAGTVR